MIWYNDAERARALKNFSTFVTVMYRHVFTEKKGQWRCDPCGGCGRVVHPDAAPDVYEGHKMSERVQCQYCGGTGIGTERMWREIYRSERASWTERRRKERERRALRESALKKLTEEERRALGV